MTNSIFQRFAKTRYVIATFIATSVAFSGAVVPRANAQEILQPQPENCVASGSVEPVQIPSSYIATIEELIADGTIDSELVEALEGVQIDYEIVGPTPRALPAVAAAAVAAVAWCVKGAFSSLIPSSLQWLAHQANNGIEPPTWVMNAIFGCAGGPVLGALTTQTMRIKFAGAVLSALIKLRNFG